MYASKPRRGLPDLATRLQWLFEHVPTRDGHRYTNETLAREVSTNGVPVSMGYIRALRSGDNSNPSASVLRDIATQFGVTMDFFTSETEAARIQGLSATLPRLSELAQLVDRLEPTEIDMVLDYARQLASDS